MTDVEKQPIRKEGESGPSMSAYAPPPYPVDPTQMQPPPPYMPPPYPPGPIVYPTYPLAEGGNTAPNPYQAYGSTDSAENVNSEPGPIIVESAFEDKSVRRAFIRKVFSVVTIQLLVTFTIVCIFTFSDKVKQAVQANIWVYISSYIVFVVVALPLSLCSSFSRTHPWNLIGLSVVTLSLSYMVGTVASFHNTTAVVIAMGATLVISFSIIVFSAQTRVDFTICNGILVVLAVDLLMFGFFSIFFYSNILQVLYGCLGAVLYSLFLAVDCQLVMGRQKYSLSPEEYVFAALAIYLDIITIFLYILIILGGSSNN